MPSASVSDHPRESRGKKAAAAAPSNISLSTDNKEVAAAYVDMVRDKKRMNRLKEWSTMGNNQKGVREGRELLGYWVTHNPHEIENMRE
jgi:hypothetical protein